MHFYSKLVLGLLWTVASAIASAQATGAADSDAEQLKIAALEALVSAPPARALPIAMKVLSGNHSDEVKSRALFILSQIDTPEAQSALVDVAATDTGELRLDAIRMIGIGGSPSALARLPDIFRNGDTEVRESVLEAYLIAGDSEAVYQIAANTADDDEFDMAVSTLGAMGARDKLKLLRGRPGDSESLIQAYAIAGDYESLEAIALDNSTPDRQLHALRALGMVGEERANQTLLEVYRSSSSEDIRESALEGMMIADYEEGVLQLFRESKDSAEKQQLLRMLVMMDSDAIIDIIDATLGGTQ